GLAAAGEAPARKAQSPPSYLNEMSRRTRKLLMLPFSIVTSSRTTSATRRSRTDFAAVSTALRAAASHDSLLTPMTWVTRYTLSVISSPSSGLTEGESLSGGVRSINDRRREPPWNDPTAREP